MNAVRLPWTKVVTPIEISADDREWDAPGWGISFLAGGYHYYPPYNKYPLCDHFTEKIHRRPLEVYPKHKRPMQTVFFRMHECTDCANIKRARERIAVSNAA